jgi:hypothetical protein
VRDEQTTKLELLASVHFLGQAHPAQANDTAQLRAALKRYGKDFSEEQIRQGCEELTHHGFGPGHLAGALFERVVLSPPIVSSVVTQLHTLAQTVFKDVCLLEFLDLPQLHSELDLQQALVANLRQFLLELVQRGRAH